MTNSSNETGKKGNLVFISYADNDRNIADMIYSALDSKGIRVWAAHRDIAPGLNWPDEISKAITGSKILILVLSSNTQKSRYVSMEVTQAEDENKIIIPFCIEEVPLRGGLKLLLGNRHWINAFPKPQEKHLDQLVETVIRHLGILPAIPIKKKKLTEQQEADKVKSVVEDVKAVKEVTMPHKDEEKPPEVVREVLKEEEIKRKKPRPHKPILMAVSIIILLTAAVIIINQLVKKDTPRDIVKPLDTPEFTSEKQKPTGKTQQKTEEKAPGKKEDVTPPQKTPTKETEKISQEEPAFIKEVKSKGVQVKQLDKGSWEAYYKEYKITMIYIPPGKFMMGSDDGEDDEKPLHEVDLDGYWISKYEVTFAQYDRYCKDAKIEKPDDKGWGRENRPVINVSWDDGTAYCQWLSKKTGLQFKLPTEAQWEKAARGNDQRKYPWGSRDADKNLANFDENIGKTTPVGSYPAGASPYGLLDMAGNVWEWCSDRYDPDYYKNLTRKNKIIKNPVGPSGGSNRVIRGGGCNGYARFLRCADRNGDGPSGRNDGLGFRLRQDI